MHETSPASAVDLAAPAFPAPATDPAPGPVPETTKGVARLRIDAAFAAAGQRLRDALYASALWRLSLRGDLPARMRAMPEPYAPATLEGAQDIMRGRFRLPTGVIEVRDRSPFDVEAPEAVRADLHRFGWLAHLEKAGGKSATHVARALTEDWLDRFERFHPLAWRPDVLGPRLIAWAAHFRMAVASNDLVFRSRLTRAIAEQTRHLARVVRDAPAGPPRLHAAAALLTMSAVLPHDERRFVHAIEALRRSLPGAILRDGGVITRSPRDQAEIVAALLRAARALDDARLPRPPFLIPAFDATRRHLARMMHGDGRLACFHGASEGDEAWLAELMRDAPQAQAAWAPWSGVARLAGDGTCVIFDNGGPPPPLQARAAHAAPGAFELSHGGARIVVNGGVAYGRGAEWIDAARRTAAHACLQLGEGDAGRVLGGAPATALGPLLMAKPVRGAMQISETGCWAEAEHEGWSDDFGAVHRRRLFLSAAGDDFRGEDRLTRPVGRGLAEIVIRFPLHPDCRAAMAQGGDSILVAPESGETWRFRAELAGDHQRLSIEPSVYMGGDVVRRAQAIVIHATLSEPEWTMRWAFNLEGALKRARRRLV